MSSWPDPLSVAPLDGPVVATMWPPGSKSITCRAHVLAALARGESRLAGTLVSEDTERLLEGLGTLGATVRREPDAVCIDGVGGWFPRGGEVNLGDGGAPSRFLIAAATLADAPVVVDGSPRLRERPVAQLIDMLRRLGAEIEHVEHEGRLPVRVMPVRPAGGPLRIGPTASSQFVSALLLVAPWLARGLTLEHEGPLTSRAYVDLTVSVLREWGATVERTAARHAVAPGPLAGRAFRVEPDASSAVYWLTAAAIAPAGTTVRVEGVGSASVQPDAGFAPAALAAMGAPVEVAPGSTAVRATGRLRGGASLDMSSMPDAALSLAAAAATAEAPTVLTGLRTLAVKETDRIAALAAELTRLGCRVEAGPDRLAIDPRPALGDPVTIETYGDHRMAMAFAVLGLARRGISIKNPGCVAKSYPTFWEDLERLRGSTAETNP